MKLTKTFTKLLIGMILLSCFISVLNIRPVTATGMTGTIVFNQTGLASGTSWIAKIGATNYTSTDSSISQSWIADIPYNWQVYVPAGYTSSSTLSGTFTLQVGQTLNINVAFTPLQNYNVTFIETGLASGTTWGVTFNGAQYSSSTPVLTITGCANGSYPYTIDTPNGYLIGTQASATLTVAGANVVKQVTFASSNSSDWYMSRRDVLHSGYANTTGPLTNNTLWITNLNEITTSSPAIVNDILYIGTGNGTIYALDTEDGSIIWEYTTGGAVKSSPAVVDEVVYVASDDQYLYALDAANGSFIWRYNVGGSNLNVSPTVVDGAVYFGEENKLFSINATDGSLNWEKTISGYFEASSPAVVDGVIYFGMYDSRSVYALNASDGSEIWNIYTWSHVCSSPTVVNGIVYIGNNEGRLYALNATAIGDPYIWDVHLGGSSAMFVSSPAYCDGVIYIGDTEGTMYARNVTDGSEIWTSPAGMFLYSSTAVADGIVYIGSNDNNVYAFNATDGSLIWTYATNGAIWSSPAVVDGTVYIGSADGKLYAFGTPSGAPVNLTMLTVGHGSVIPGNATYYQGSSVDLKAIPAAGWSFSGWTGDASGAENTTITMTGNKTVTATFTQDTYYLTMVTVGQGTVNPGNNSYASGSTIDIEAINQVGWTFDSWSGAAEGLTNTTVLMNANKTVIATFTQNNYTLTMYTVGQGSAFPGNQTYLSGSEVTIEAIPSRDWTFSGWSGSTSGSNSTKTIFMTENMTITATFVPYAHTISVYQGSHGTISPSSIEVTDGDSQTFTISPATGYHIVDVIVDSSSVGAVASYTFTNVHEDHTISATFAANEYTLTVTTVGNGTATPTPATATYHYGETVQLNAFPDNGWVFSGWSGDASGTTNTTITINGNKVVTANFAQDSYQVAFDLTGLSSSFNGVVLTVDGVGYTIADLPQIFTWTHGSVHTYVFNQTLPVSSGERYVWTSTQGASTLQSGSLTITEAATVTAAYSIQYQLTVTTAQGTTSGSGWYTAGTSATAQVSQSTVTSGADTRYLFNGWSGDAQSSQSTVSIVMDEPKTVAANWETQYLVTVTANPAAGGTTTPSTAIWMTAGILDISCTTNADYTFDSWSSTPQIVIASPTTSATTATINGPGTITANFDQTATTIYVKAQNGETTELKLHGNISSSQLSNAKITSSITTRTTKITLSATGPSGTVGFSNITIAKSSVAHGTKPVVYIDNTKAANQGYTQDNDNYYVWFTTHFSEHEISIEFISEEAEPTPTQQPSTNNLALPAAFAVAIIAIVLVGLLIQHSRKDKK